MRPTADELQLLPPRFALWHAYDRVAKTELHSSALLVRSGLVLIDPIELNRRASDELASLGPVKSILITNANHRRASDFFCREYGAQIFGPPELTNKKLGIHRFPDDGPKTLMIVPIPGAAPGEVAVYDSRDGGTLIVGDALINFEPYGFTFLPAKYCLNQKLMIRSLQALVDFEFERLFFAHGLPITSDARNGLISLLQERS